jgi:hypothetical protein
MRGVCFYKERRSVVGRISRASHFMLLLASLLLSGCEGGEQGPGRLECDPNPAGCVVRFDDPEWKASARDALYYVRALQEPTPAINGGGLRTRFDSGGNPVSIDICYGDARTPLDDECLAPAQERAWSSPIFIDQMR